MRVLRVDVQLVVSLMLALMRMLKRVLMLMEGRVSRVEPHASGEGATTAVGTHHARCVGQLVVLRAQTTEPDEAVLGDEHRRARGRRLLVATGHLLHRGVPVASLRAPHGLYTVAVPVQRTAPLVREMAHGARLANGMPLEST